MNIIKFFLGCSILIANSAVSQCKYLPDDTKDITVTESPQSVPDMRLIETNGYTKISGQTGCNGKTGYTKGDILNVDYSFISVKIQHYKPTETGKFLLSQILQYDNAQMKADRQKAEMKNEVNNAGESKYYYLDVSDVAEGKLVIGTEKIVCVESHIKEVYSTFFKSFAVVGNTIVEITCGYYSKDPSLAKQIHNNIITKIKSCNF